MKRIILNKGDKFGKSTVIEYSHSDNNKRDFYKIQCECGNVDVLKAWKYWLEFPELIKKLKEIKQLYNVRVLYIESKASGLSIKQQLQRDGLDVADLTPKDKDKITRANAVAPKIEGGHLWFVEDTWNEMVLQELAGFPFGKDDLVDTTVYSIDTLLNKGNFNYSF